MTPYKYKSNQVKIYPKDPKQKQLTRRACAHTHTHIHTNTRTKSHNSNNILGGKQQYVMVIILLGLVSTTLRSSRRIESKGDHYPFYRLCIVGQRSKKDGWQRWARANSGTRYCRHQVQDGWWHGEWYVKQSGYIDVCLTSKIWRMSHFFCWFVDTANFPCARGKQAWRTTMWEFWATLPLRSDRFCRKTGGKSLVKLCDECFIWFAVYLSSLYDVILPLLF